MSGSPKWTAGKILAWAMVIALLLGIGDPAIAGPISEQTSTISTAAPIFERIAGSDRIETSIEISKTGFPSGSAKVVLARSDNFADALAGSYLAGQNNAPILITSPANLSPKVLTEIGRLGATDVIVLGGKAAISDTVTSQLTEAGLIVERLRGASRYETAVSIATSSPASAVGTDNTGLKTAIIGSGTEFADLLGAGPIAYANLFPVMLTPSNSLPSSVSTAIGELGIQHVILLGGEAAVSDGVEEQLVALGIVVTRLSGTNRYNTAVAIAEYALSNELAEEPNINVATGLSFPDGLSLGPLGGKHRTVTILVGTTPTTELCKFLGELEPAAGYVVGGTTAINSATVGLLEDCAIPPPPAPFEAGTKLIGVDIPAGTYVAVNLGSCYWERLSALSGEFTDILANNSSEGHLQQIVTVLPSDTAFNSVNCGIWQPIADAGLTPIAAPPGDGVWLVGGQLSPGIYRTVNVFNFCYWQRSSGFTGDLSEILANEITTEGKGILEIQNGDVGIVTSRCGPWEKI